MEHESNDCTNCDWCVRPNNERIIKRPGRLGSWRTGRDYPNDSIAKNGQNPETSPGDLRRLDITQTPVKNHQLTLIWKNSKGVNNNDYNNNRHEWGGNVIHCESCKKLEFNHTKRGICTTQNLSKRMRLTNISGIL